MTAPASLRERVRSGIVWNSVSTLSLQGGTFLTHLLVANMLGPERFGQFGVVINTAQTVAAVLQLSTGIAATKYISQYRRIDRQLASRALGLCERVSLRAGLAGTFGLALLANLIATDLLATPTLGLQLAIAAPVVLFSVLTGFQTGALAGLEGFRSAARAVLLLAVVQVGSVALVAWWFGLTGAVIGTCANFALRAWVFHRLIRREALGQGISPTSGRGTFEREAFFGFLLPASLNGLTTMPSMWLATAALSRSAGGFGEVAYFNAALAIRAILMIFPWILSGVMLSLLSHHIAADKQSQFRNLLIASLTVTFAAVVAGQGLILLFGDRLLGLYGKSFLAGLPVLHVLMVSFAAEALVLPLYQALTSRGRMWSIFAIAVLPRDLLVAALALLWIDRHGAVGLAWAHSLAYVFTLLTSAGLVYFDRRGRTGRAGA